MYAIRSYYEGSLLEITAHCHFQNCTVTVKDGCCTGSCSELYLPQNIGLWTGVDPS